jgi:Domain of unknown function (DUF4394)
VNSSMSGTPRTTIGHLRRYALGLLFAMLSAITSNRVQAAPVLFAIDPTLNRLVSFVATSPGVLLTDGTLSGLQANELILGIDFRPSDGQLYALSKVTSGGRLLRINVSTLAVAQVATIATSFSDAYFYGISFTPDGDVLRVVSTAAENMAINPTSGAVTVHSGLAYPAGPDLGTVNETVHIAYTNRTPGALTTTLYGIDRINDRLTRIGGIGTGLTSAATGTLTNIGPLNAGNVTGYGGFDIEPGTNNAYAILRVAGASRVYRMSLETGAAQDIGAIGTDNGTYDGLTIAPPESCLDVDGNGGVEATKDGIMILRAMLGITGTAVHEGLLSRNSSRRDWSEIRKHLNGCGGNFAP